MIAVSNDRPQRASLMSSSLAAEPLGGARFDLTFFDDDDDDDDGGGGGGTPSLSPLLVALLNPTVALLVGKARQSDACTTTTMSLARARAHACFR